MAFLLRTILEFLYGHLLRLLVFHTPLGPSAATKELNKLRAGPRHRQPGVYVSKDRR